MNKNQRFIAGANCPNCQSIDSLLLNQDDQSIECVDCAYTESALDRDNKQNKKTNTDVIEIKIINN